MTMNFNIAFRTLDARRLSSTKAQVNINNNSTITAVTKDGEKLNISFVFSSNYEPNVGQVRIEGDLIIEGTANELDDAIREWEKSDKSNLPKEMAEKVHNNILSNCVVEASILARDLKLPAPIPMPHVSLNNKENPQDTNYIR